MSKINICKKHENEIRFVCEDCKLLICQICFDDDHENHHVINFKKKHPLREMDDFKEFLGKGGYGSVYKAISIKENITYAIKLILYFGLKWKKFS